MTDTKKPPVEDPVDPLDLDLTAYPSAIPAFGWVSSSLATQVALYESLVNRILGCFGVATAVVGLGIPIALTRVPHDLPLLAVVTLLPGLAWIRLSWLALISLELRPIQTLDDPTWVREEFWILPAERFEVAMYPLIERYYLDNRAEIAKKRELVKGVYRWSAITTALVVINSVLLVLVGLTR